MNSTHTQLPRCKQTNKQANKQTTTRLILFKLISRLNLVCFCQTTLYSTQNQKKDDEIRTMLIIIFFLVNYQIKIIVLVCKLYHYYGFNCMAKNQSDSCNFLYLMISSHVKTDIFFWERTNSCFVIYIIISYNCCPILQNTSYSSYCLMC